MKKFIPYFAFFAFIVCSAQVFGPTIRTPRLTVSPGPTVVEDLTVNGTCTGCGGGGGGVEQTTGDFTASFTIACTITPSQLFNYVLTGDVVVLRVTQNITACTGDSSLFETAAGDLPLALRPAATVTFGGIICADSGATVPCSLVLETDGTVAYCENGATVGAINTCGASNWTASGTRLATVSTSRNVFVYPLN
jgi:hypothetical protein